MLLHIACCCIASPVVINIKSGTVIGVQGRNITLTFRIVEDEPKVIPVDTRWYFKTDNVTTEIFEGTRTSFSPDRLVLIITDLTLMDQGWYTVNAANIIGTGSSSVFLDVQSKQLVLWY